MIPSSEVWKLALAFALGGGDPDGRLGTAPPAARSRGADLRRLVARALLLYGVGGLASLSGHPTLAALAYAAGISVCALAPGYPAAATRTIPPRRRGPLRRAAAPCARRTARV